MTVKPWGIGLFIVLGIGLFTGILFLIGDREEAFSRHLDVYSEFSNLSGLATGAKVRVSGLDAGEIRKIGIPNSPSAKFRLELRIEKRLNAMVREDSVVSIETDGVVGDKFISIKKGTDQAAEAQAGSTLPSKEPLDIAALMEKGSALLNDLHGTVAGVNSTITDIRGRADVALDSVTRTVNHTDGLIVGVRPDLNKMVSNGSQITGTVNTLVSDLNDGKGAAGLLLRDEATRQQLRSTLTNVEQASTNLDQASARANETLADFQSRKLIANAQVTLDNIQSLSRELNISVKDALAQDTMGEDGASNIRQTLSNLNRSTTNIAEDTEALKHNFFFRGFFKKRGFYNIDDVTPEEYLKACERQKGVGTRMWLQAANLVVSGNGGQEQLSEAGRLQIDGELSPIVESLPGYMIIVEGYSRSGSPDQQFVISRRRADIVRQYLEVHFHVRHSDVGIVPLLNTPPQGSGRGSWDGAAIMLLKVDARK
jgi:phospholipid/cholesterol/gamma-HCH transport system substrate-binding protein